MGRLQPKPAVIVATGYRVGRHEYVASEPNCVHCGVFGPIEASELCTPEREGVPQTFALNQRVYHKRMDLFGDVCGFAGLGTQTVAFVKYGWPYDAKAPPQPVPLGELTAAEAPPARNSHEIR